MSRFRQDISISPLYEVVLGTESSIQCYSHIPWRISEKGRMERWGEGMSPLCGVERGRKSVTDGLKMETHRELEIKSVQPSEDAAIFS
jgi:hypothetical protein